MSEKNYVVNVKTKLGTIFTVRADSASELNQNIKDVLLAGVNDSVGALEEFFIGGSSVPIATITTNVPVQTGTTTTNPVDVVVNAVNGTVISEPAPTYAPAPVAVPEQGNNSVAPPCRHGSRTWVTAKPGSGKSWKAWMCPQPQGATDKCDPVWVK